MSHAAPTITAVAAVSLHALDHGPWMDTQSRLRRAMEARHLESLTAPTTLILHDVLDSALRVLHLDVFRHVLEHDLGMPMEPDSEALDALFRSELAEHGTQNVARACQAAERALQVAFPGEDAVLFQLTLPCAWARSLCKTDTLIDALGFDLQVSATPTASCIRLTRRPDRQATLAQPALLAPGACRDSLHQIFGQLGYGLIDFSATGEILAVSPSMLQRLRLDADAGAVAALAAAIPLNFHNDILWGLALAEGNGAFENYRIRVRLPGSARVSILFNVSGFREADGTIRSLWQAVSQDEGGAQLSEGSILSEVRIHNITRNYVPQLVEQKAREAVRLGKTALTNEERPIAVLFCDIVGFTSYVERNADSESIIDTLNSILRRISGSVKRNRGAIDKFMGDCIMALFDDPADAVLAAIDMQSHSEDINGLRSRAGQQTLQLRIGIHWGNVIVGNVGTAERLDWTAIGDVVNTASRIEKGCQPGAILISGSLRATIESAHPGRFDFSEFFGLQVKGKRDALTVCHVTLQGDMPAT